MLANDLQRHLKLSSTVLVYVSIVYYHFYLSKNLFIASYYVSTNVYFKVVVRFTNT